MSSEPLTDAELERLEIVCAQLQKGAPEARLAAEAAALDEEGK